MKNVLLLIADILIPVGAAQGKVGRYATQLGERRHSHGRIVRQFEAAQTIRCK